MTEERVLEMNNCEPRLYIGHYAGVVHRYVDLLVESDLEKIRDVYFLLTMKRSCVTRSVEKTCIDLKCIVL